MAISSSSGSRPDRLAAGPSLSLEDRHHYKTHRRDGGEEGEDREGEIAHAVTVAATAREPDATIQPATIRPMAR
jgi:hypothetical protein